MIKYLIATSALIISTISLAQVTESNVPGGVKKITIQSDSKPQASFNGKRIAIIKKNNEYLALVGIPISTKVSSQKIIQSKPEEKTYTFKLKSKKYPTQRLTIKNKRKVTPLAADQKRIAFENADMKKTLSHWSDNDQIFAKPLTSPIRGPITSYYGMQRIYNGIPKSPHTALDIYAPLGTPIVAAMPGRIINIHKRFYTELFK